MRNSRPARGFSTTEMSVANRAAVIDAAEHAGGGGSHGHVVTVDEVNEGVDGAGVFKVGKDCEDGVEFIGVGVISREDEHLEETGDDGWSQLLNRLDPDHGGGFAGNGRHLDFGLAFDAGGAFFKERALIEPADERLGEQARAPIGDSAHAHEGKEAQRSRRPGSPFSPRRIGGHERTAPG